MPSRHHSPRDLQKLVQTVRRIWWMIAPRKGWNHLRWHRTAKNVRASADRGSRVENCADSRFCVVPEERAEELQSRVAFALGGPEFHRAVRVLQIAGDRSRAKVDPAAQVGVPDIAVVSFVRMSQKNRGAHFTVHFADVADRGSRDLVAADERLPSNDAGPDEPGEGLNSRAVPYQHGSGAGVEE